MILVGGWGGGGVAARGLCAPLEALKVNRQANELLCMQKTATHNMPRVGSRCSYCERPEASVRCHASLETTRAPTLEVLCGISVARLGR